MLDPPKWADAADPTLRPSSPKWRRTGECKGNDSPEQASLLFGLHSQHIFEACLVSRIGDGLLFADLPAEVELRKGLVEGAHSILGADLD